MILIFSLFSEVSNSFEEPEKKELISIDLLIGGVIMGRNVLRKRTEDKRLGDYNKLINCLVTVESQGTEGFKVGLLGEPGSNNESEGLYDENKDYYYHMEGEHEGEVELPQGVYVDKVKMGWAGPESVDVKFYYGENDKFVTPEEAVEKIQIAVATVSEAAMNKASESCGSLANKALDCVETVVDNVGSAVYNVLSETNNEEDHRYY